MPTSAPPAAPAYILTGRVEYQATLKHNKGGDPLEWPADLRVREFPR